jgi:hypothetical protein
MQGTGTFAIIVANSTDLQLSAGDTVRCRALQSSGGNQIFTTDAKRNHISIHKIG